MSFAISGEFGLSGNFAKARHELVGSSGHQMPSLGPCSQAQELGFATSGKNGSQASGHEALRPAFSARYFSVPGAPRGCSAGWQTMAYPGTCSTPRALITFLNGFSHQPS